MIARAAGLALAPAVVVGVFGITPLVGLVVMSFGHWDPVTQSFSLNFDLAGYQALFATGAWAAVAGVFLRALLAAGFSVALAVPIAFAICFLSSRRVALGLTALFALPLLLPHFGWDALWESIGARVGAVFGPLLESGSSVVEVAPHAVADGSAVSLVIVCLPWAVLPLVYSMRQVEPEALAVSRDLGAGFLVAVRSILLPQITKGLAAGLTLAFVAGTGLSLASGPAASVSANTANGPPFDQASSGGLAASTVIIAVLIGVIVAARHTFVLQRPARAIYAGLQQEPHSGTILIWLTVGFALALFLVPVAFAAWETLRLMLQWSGLASATGWKFTADPTGRQPLFEIVSVSVVLAATAALIGTALGVLGALAHQRLGRGRQIWFILMMAPLLVPGSIQGLSLKVAFFLAGIGSGLTVLIVNDVLLVTPIAFLAVLTRLLVVEPIVIMEAEELGASRWRRFSDVVMPAIGAGVAGAFVLCFTISLSAFDRSAVMPTIGLAVADVGRPDRVWMVAPFLLTSMLAALAFGLFARSSRQ